MLTQALQDQDSMVYDVAANALSKRGEPAIPGLVAAISSDNVDLRGSAIEALGEIGSETAIPYLVDALQDAECPQWEDNSICDLAADAHRQVWPLLPGCKYGLDVGAASRSQSTAGVF